jgi:AcrR family transcriptional regulator
VTQKVATRERIRRAALGVFAGKGYHRASVDAIGAPVDAEAAV